MASVSNLLRFSTAAALLSTAALAPAQVPAALKPYVSEDSPSLVLMHVRVIDGTGAAAVEDQRIDIEAGKITRVQSAKLRNAFAPNAKVLDLSGRTVIPGLVGMHEHLFYTGPERGKDGLPFWIEMIDSGPRLYLAGGVTTARTAGSMEPYTDLSLKKIIDAGDKPGPKLRITGPYIGDLLGIAPQLHTLNGPEDAGRTVDYWAAEGVTSFKAYMGIKPEELKVAVEHAHAKGLKITGHLCAVGFTEAAELGIDNLEHGIIVDTEFLPSKKRGVVSCQGSGGRFCEECRHRVRARASDDSYSGRPSCRRDVHARGVRNRRAEPAVDAQDAARQGRAQPARLGDLPASSQHHRGGDVP